MEVSSEILLNSLANAGVPIPAGCSAVEDLTPATLFSLCSHALRLIGAHPHAPPSFPEESMPDRVRICTDLACAFNSLGFNPRLDFHKFLYPSEEDLYKLVRFLVAKLSESSGDRTAVIGNGDSIRCDAKEKFGEGDNTLENKEILDGIKDLRLKTQELESSLDQSAAEPNPVVHNVEVRVEESKAKEEVFCPRERSNGDRPSFSLDGEGSSRKNDFRDQGGSQNQEVRKNPIGANYSGLQHPDEELQLTKAAAEEIELETVSILAEIKRREEELAKLSSDLEKQPKLAPRRSYIERINEITKNSRKQDNDIQLILKDTRELQLESNTIQERLNRTYAFVDETIFREAKKDPVARQAYRLLKDIHESFEQIGEKILEADRSRREAADYEAKLAIISARSMNMDKLQADLDAVRKENDLLEQRLH